VDSLSFSRAAEANYVTQSAVSQQVRGLETKFKRKLLERVRGRREVRLTKDGEAFYQESRNVVAAYLRLEERMRTLTGTVSGAVHVATVYSIGVHELPPGVRRFVERCPEAEIDREDSGKTSSVRHVVARTGEPGVVA